MKRVSTVEIIHNFSVHGDAALTEPIIVTKGGRDRLVLMSLERYDALRHAYDAVHGKRAERQRSPRRILLAR